MDYRDKSIQTQLRNIEAKTGKTLAELDREVLAHPGDPNSGPKHGAKHGALRTHLMETYGLSFVHADTLLLCLAQMRAEAAGTAPADPLDAIYVGAKASLRPIHERVVAALASLGPYETAPKKGYVSLRRAKQFCMVGPGTKGRLTIGINARTLTPTERLAQLPPGKLCPLEVHLTSVEHVDDELVGWLRVAYGEAR